MVNGEYEKTKAGTQQGGNLSPLLSNIMINELDKEQQQRGQRCVRNADDCIIMAKSEMSARRIKRNVTRYIEEKLDPVVNEEKSKIMKPSKLKLLGFGFYYSSSKRIHGAKPHAKSVLKFKHKLKELSKRNWGISMDERIKRINQIECGWVNYLKIGDMKKVLKGISEHLR